METMEYKAAEPLVLAEEMTMEEYLLERRAALPQAEYGDKRTMTFRWSNSSYIRPDGSNATGSATFTKPNTVEGYKAMVKFIRVLAAKQIPFSVTY